MSNGSYFAQYESPNIVIVPTMSCNPPAPKQRKIGNNIVVPIVNSATWEKQKLIRKANIKSDDSNAGKKIDESLLKSPSVKNSCPNLQDKKYAIRNRKIPKKTTSHFMNPKPIAAEITPTSTCVPIKNIEKCDEKKTPIKNGIDRNILNDSNTKTIHVIAQNSTIKSTSKKDMQSKYKSTKEKSLSAVESVKTITTLTRKNKNVPNDSYKRKIDNTKKYVPHEQPINLCASGRQSSQTVSKKAVNVKPQADLNSKQSTKYSSVIHKKKSENLVMKSKIESVVKQNVQDNRRKEVKTKYNQRKTDGAKSSAHHSTTNYKEKYNNPKYSIGNENSVKSVKGTKKYDISDLKKLAVSEKVKHNNEIKTKDHYNKTKINNKTKAKNVSSKSKSNFTSNKKPVMASIKKKITKTRKDGQINVFVHVICNNRNPPQSNASPYPESNRSNTTSKISNVDLDFLNDFNVDEIVESLDTCEKKTSQLQPHRGLNQYQNKGNGDAQKNISNIHTDYKDNTDVIDLIKTLKGEEDDDLMQISIESSQELLFTKIQTQDTENIYNVSKFSERQSKENNETKLAKMEVTKSLETISEPLQPVSCDATCNFNKNKSNIKEEQNINSFQCDINSFPVFDKDNFASDKLKNNNLKNFGNSLLTMFNENQNKNEISLDEKHQKAADTANVREIVDKINSTCTDRLNLVQTDIYNADVPNFKYENKQKDNATDDIQQSISEKLNSEVQIYAQKQKEENADNKNAIDEIIKNVESIKNQNDNEVTNSINKVLPQHNDSKINIIENSRHEKETSIPDEKGDQDKYKSDKKGCYDGEDFYKPIVSLESANKIETLSNFSNSDKNTHGDIKTKADLETVLKLEEVLYTCSGSKYSITSIIHTGKFSKIFRCKHPNGKYYALKIPTTNIKYSLGKEKKQMLNFLVSDIPKNNLFIVCLTSAFNVAENWYYLLEYYPKNLNQVMNEAEKPFSIDQIQDYARQLVMAVMVLRNKNMLHLDINPKHILINSSNNVLKLCGFDRLCYIDQLKILPNIGTVNYRAPEVILGYESGFEIDVWSTGLVLYEMATNKKLFPGIYNNDILFKQICTLGRIPYDMIKKSRFVGAHFTGSKFMRKSGFKGQNVKIIGRFRNNNKLCDSIYDAYFENWRHQSASQQNCDIGKLSLFVKLLQKMLIIHPEYRLPIEFVYANPFIYDAYSYQEW